jgi:hypothetical protein
MKVAAFINRYPKISRSFIGFETLTHYRQGVEVVPNARGHRGGAGRSDLHWCSLTDWSSSTTRGRRQRPRSPRIALTAR